MKFWVAPAYTPAQWLDYLIDSFDQLYEEGASEPKMLSVGVHLRIIGPRPDWRIRQIPAARRQPPRRVDRLAPCNCATVHRAEPTLNGQFRAGAAAARFAYSRFHDKEAHSESPPSAALCMADSQRPQVIRGAA
jgi:hypothetical protein